MSPEILEIFFFAIVAFFVFNKLSAVLGSEDANENMPKNIKIVRGDSADQKSVIFNVEITKEDYVVDFDQQEILEFINEEKKDQILSKIEQIKQNYPAFTLRKFLQSTEKSYQEVVQAFIDQKTDLLRELCNKEIYDLLVIKIDNLRKKKHQKFIQLVDLKQKIDDIKVNNEKIVIQINFCSNQFSYMVDEHEKLISGSKNKEISVNEKIIFAYGNSENMTNNKWIIDAIS